MTGKKFLIFMIFLHLSGRCNFPVQLGICKSSEYDKQLIMQSMAIWFFF